MDNKLFATALGLSEPWFVDALNFDEPGRKLTVRIGFRQGARFEHAGFEGAHPVHDTLTKRYRHLNFFQHECELEVRVPRIRLPDGSVAQVDPSWVGRRSGFRLLFEALDAALRRQMPFEAASRVQPRRVGPMKAFAMMIRRRVHGLAAWARNRQADGASEALDGLFRSAGGRVRG